MNEAKVKISKEGRILIPLDIRKSLQLQEGDELILRIEDGELRLLTLDQAVHQAQQLYRTYAGNRSLKDELIAERRESAKYES